MTGIIDEIVEMFDKYGNKKFGEAVSLREHMLQTAFLAEQDAASQPLIAASLLHDIGYFIIYDKQIEQILEPKHERIGADYLSQYFYEEITGPIRFHILAKRYKCANNPEYVKNLSSESLNTLEQQGGPLSEYDRKNFEYHLHFASSVRLRLWDDKAKIPGIETPNLEHFIPCLKAGLIR